MCVHIVYQNIKQETNNSGYLSLVLCFDFLGFPQSPDIFDKRKVDEQLVQNNKAEAIKCYAHLWRKIKIVCCI